MALRISILSARAANGSLTRSMIRRLQATCSSRASFATTTTTSKKPHPSALVSCQWLSENLENVRLLDASWFMPSACRSPATEHAAERIPGAVFFDIDTVCDKGSSLPHMIPPPEQFARQVGEMGISNNTPVVVYDSWGMLAASARVWWMFRLFGHDNVTVLRGGLPTWRKYRLPLVGDAPAAPPATKFEASFRPELLKTYEQVKKNSTSYTFQLIDARPSARFQGLVDEPRPNVRRGFVPGSTNLPFGDLFVEPNLAPGYHNPLLAPSVLRKVMVNAGVSLVESAPPIAAMCGSGVTAAAVALALHEVGIPNCAVYDGSWTEYGQIAGSA